MAAPEEHRTSAERSTADAGGPAGVPLAHARIGRYTVIRVIGAGGMGIVYEAEQDVPRRIVALKVMNRKDGEGGRALDDTGMGAGVRRFLNEAQFLAAQSHPSICQVFDAGMHTPADGSPPVPYIAMEHVAGARRLDAHCRALGLSVRARVELFARVCDAVGHAHGKGVIHRDLKHENVLVNEAGEPKVIDFGIARVLGTDVFRTRITQVGQVLGTLQYMSPEQLAGRHDEVDKRSDVYALGVMLYELVCGRSPREFEGLDPLRIAARVRETAATRPTSVAAEVDADMETIVMAAIDPEPSRRYADAGELCAELNRWLAREPIVKRPLGPAARAWRRVRAMAGRNRLVSALGVAIAAFVLAAFVLVPPVSRASRSTERWASWMMASSSLSTQISDLSPVTVVTMGDGDDLRKLMLTEAHSEADVDQLGGLRPMLGAVTRALTVAGARTMVLDFGIGNIAGIDPENTRPLVDAVRTAAKEGVGVVVGVDSWPMMAVREDVLNELAPYVRWGGFHLGVDPSGPWMAEIAHHVPGMDTSPGLALAAYASYLRPNPAEALRVAYAGEQDQIMDVWFSRPADDSIVAGGVRGVGERGPRVVITGTFVEASANGGENEITAELHYEIPQDSVLNAATMTLTELFAKASAGTLGAAVRGKIVLVGDTTSGTGDISPDRLRPAGVARVYGHATAIVMLVRHMGPHIPTDLVGNVWTGAACAAGALGAILVGSWRRLAVLMLALTVGVILCSVCAFGGWGLLVDPLEPLAGLWLGVVLSFLLNRTRM